MRGKLAKSMTHKQSTADQYYMRVMRTDQDCDTQETMAEHLSDDTDDAQDEMFGASDTNFIENSAPLVQNEDVIRAVEEDDDEFLLDMESDVEDAGEEERLHSDLALATPSKRKYNPWDGEDSAIVEGIVTPNRSKSPSIKELIQQTPPAIRERYGDDSVRSKIKRTLNKPEPRIKSTIPVCLQPLRASKRVGGWSTKDENDLWKVVGNLLTETAKGKLETKQGYPCKLKECFPNIDGTKWNNKDGTDQKNENPLIERFNGFGRIRTKTSFWFGKLNEKYGAQNPPKAPKPQKRKKK